jgi:hypothetical protein
MSSSRPRRRFRGLLITVVILVVLGFVADRAAESFAEDRLAVLAEDEAAKYDVRATDTSVEVGGFGFLPQLARGEFSEVTLTMKQPTVSAVQAEDLTVAMSGVHVPRQALTGDPNAAVTVDSSDVQLRLSPAALTKLVARTSGLDGLTLRIAGGKLQAQVKIQGVEAAATVQPQAQNGRIRLVVSELSGSIPSAIRELLTSQLAQGIQLPELPFGASLKQVAVEGQAIALTATAANVQFAGP